MSKRSPETTVSDRSPPMVQIELISFAKYQDLGKKETRELCPSYGKGSLKPMEVYET